MYVLHTPCVLFLPLETSGMPVILSMLFGVGLVPFGVGWGEADVMVYKDWA